LQHALEECQKIEQNVLKFKIKTFFGV